MSKLLYSLGIFLYRSLIFLMAPINEKARLRLKGIKNNRLIYSMMRRDTNPRVWFHAASLGEFEQARPLIESYRKIHPDKKIVLSFFSPSGYEVRKNYSGADFIFYLPMDTRRNARKLLENIQPAEVFFIKYEFWYHILSEIQRKKIPLYLISGIFRENQPFFRIYGSWFLKKIAGFSHLFVQNQISLDLLHKHGITNCTLSGDTRFDRVAELITLAKPIPILEKFKQDCHLLIAGSTWPPEEEILADWISSMPVNWKMIIAPHEVNAAHISAIRERFHIPTRLYSEALAGKAVHDAKLLIIDNIGMLTSIYAYGSLAVVGGAFKTGLHNVLEPAAYGIPVIFGPIYHKFDEAKGLLLHQGAISVDNPADFLKALDSLSSDETLRKRMSASAKEFVINHQGAVKIILSHLNSVESSC